jgi:hypothetical protein
MPKPTPDEVRSQLKSFGCKIDNFNQSESGRASKDEQLREGYCEGVCLDWIRRVLQGGRPSFSPKAVAGSNPQYDFQRKIQSQAERQAHAWQKWGDTKQQWQDSKQTVFKKRYVDEWNEKFTPIRELETLEDHLLALLKGHKATTIELTPTILTEIKQCFGKSIGGMQDTNNMIDLYDLIPEGARGRFVGAGSR